MIVAVSRIPLPKTERYLYWVRVAYEKSPLVGGFSHAETEWREKSCGFDRMQSAAFTRPLREMQLEEYSLQFHQKSIIILIKLRRILCCTAFSWMV